MTFEEAKEVTEKIRYKDGWVFKLTDHPTLRCVQLELNWSVIDIFTRETMKLGNRSILKVPNLKGMTERKFVEWVGSKVHYIETHEFREWFKVSEEPVYDPHPEKY